MKYNVKTLAIEYEKWVADTNFDVKRPSSQIEEYSTYNEYSYRKIMQDFDRLYGFADSTEITEKFLKGE